MNELKEGETRIVKALSVGLRTQPFTVVDMIARNEGGTTVLYKPNQGGPKV